MASMKALQARPNSAAVSSWSGMSHPLGTWCRSSQSRVHRLALQSEHAEHAFVHTRRYSPAALQRGLNETALRVARHEVARLDDHAVAAAPGQLLPPGDAVRNARRVASLHHTE